MEVQLESLSPSPLQQHGPWHFHDSRLQQAPPLNLGAALLQAAVPVLNDRLQEISRVNRPIRQSTSESSDNPKPTKEASTAPLMPTRPGAKVPPITKPCDVDQSPALEDVKAPCSALAFSSGIPHGQVVLTFPLREASAPAGPFLKRGRPDTDVDGFNTAALGCKKRRLLRNMVTSRLSSPFSHPATHILNREGVICGDKRFLKLAALAAARRMNGPGGLAQAAPPPPSQSSLMRRAAVMNSFRLRMRTEAEREDDMDRPRIPDASLLEPSRGPMSTVDARFLGSFQPPAPPTPAVRISFQTPMSPITRARIQARASTPGSPTGLRPTEPPGPRHRLSPSPRLRPLRSPELRTTRPLVDLEDFDALDDESVAFPTSEHESRYEDEPEEVYADFGVIFGGDGESSEDENADHFEDYLDDVDGIPWNARC
ncbi:hypothetical protein OQA88_5842 [Cercophora sp. LCS_1]